MIDIVQSTGSSGIERTAFRWTLLVGVALIFGSAAGSVTAAALDSGSASQVLQSQSTLSTARQIAPVIVDGRILFELVGTGAYPAEKRARDIAERIGELAAKPGFSVDNVRIQEEPNGSVIVADDSRLLIVLDDDARIAALQRQALALAFAKRIKEAIIAYREERSPHYLRRSALEVLLASVLLGLFLWVTRMGVRRLLSLMERRYRVAVDHGKGGSLGTVAAEQFWQVIVNTQLTFWWLTGFAAVYFYLELALDKFPWTRDIARWLLDLVLDPLRAMGLGILRSIPNLVYIVILFLVVRYVLQLLALLFMSVGRGVIRWLNFEPEWAMPTFKILRTAIIAFAVVVAYPYIPGSNSEAFKGISVFIGVLFSVGASGMLSNILAGYTILYRRAFRAGDRVTIGQHTGDIVETRQQTTLLRTPKNEDIIIPNSEILSAVVVNYSSMARHKQLILHTTVTIGYDAPWRQVEAMLLMAAARTEGLLTVPPPFVLKTGLDDFYVRYEINAYCDDASRMPRLYSSLHQSIIDVFNEFGVQIMSPHFEAQPPAPTVVPREKWHAAPAAGATDERGGDVQG